MNTLQLNSDQYIIIIVALIGLISPLVSVSFKLLSKFQANRLESEQMMFKRYHTLIEEITSNKKKFADCQIASIYELRKFRSRRFVTKRVLTSFYDATKGPNMPPQLEEAILSTIRNVKNPLPLIWRFKDH